MTQDILIELLQDQIKALEDEIENSHENQVLEKHKSIIKDLKRDKNFIIEIDLSIIEEILDELQVLEKNEILDYFDIIQKLLKLNKEKHTTYKLTESQLEYINIFIEIIDNYKKERKKAYDKKIKLHKNYQDLLTKLIKRQERITELDTLKHLFKDLSITEEDQNRILITLMKYNKNLTHQNETFLPSWDV